MIQNKKDPSGEPTDQGFKVADVNNSESDVVPDKGIQDNSVECHARISMASRMAMMEKVMVSQQLTIAWPIRLYSAPVFADELESDPDTKADNVPHTTDEDVSVTLKFQGLESQSLPGPVSVFTRVKIRHYRNSRSTMQSPDGSTLRSQLSPDRVNSDREMISDVQKENTILVSQNEGESFDKTITGPSKQPITFEFPFPKTDELENSHPHQGTVSIALSATCPDNKMNTLHLRGQVSPDGRAISAEGQFVACNDNVVDDYPEKGANTTAVTVSPQDAQGEDASKTEIELIGGQSTICVSEPQQLIETSKRSSEGSNIKVQKAAESKASEEVGVEPTKQFSMDTMETNEVVAQQTLEIEDEAHVIESPEDAKVQTVQPSELRAEEEAKAELGETQEQDGEPDLKEQVLVAEEQAEPRTEEIQDEGADKVAPQQASEVVSEERPEVAGSSNRAAGETEETVMVRNMESTQNIDPQDSTINVPQTQDHEQPQSALDAENQPQAQQSPSAVEDDAKNVPEVERTSAKDATAVSSKTQDEEQPEKETQATDAPDSKEPEQNGPVDEEADTEKIPPVESQADKVATDAPTTETKEEAEEKTNLAEKQADETAKDIPAAAVESKPDSKSKSEPSTQSGTGKKACASYDQLCKKTAEDVTHTVLETILNAIEEDGKISREILEKSIDKLTAKSEAEGSVKSAPVEVPQPVKRISAVSLDRTHSERRLTLIEPKVTVSSGGSVHEVTDRRIREMAEGFTLKVLATIMNLLEEDGVLAADAIEKSLQNISGTSDEAQPSLSSSENLEEKPAEEEKSRKASVEQTGTEKEVAEPPEVTASQELLPVLSATESAPESGVNEKPEKKDTVEDEKTLKETNKRDAEVNTGREDIMYPPEAGENEESEWSQTVHRFHYSHRRHFGPKGANQERQRSPHRSHTPKKCNTLTRIVSENPQDGSEVELYVRTPSSTFGRRIDENHENSDEVSSNTATTTDTSDLQRMTLTLLNTLTTTAELLRTQYERRKARTLKQHKARTSHSTQPDINESRNEADALATKNASCAEPNCRRRSKRRPVRCCSIPTANNSYAHQTEVLVRKCKSPPIYGLMVPRSKHPEGKKPPLQTTQQSYQTAESARQIILSPYQGEVLHTKEESCKASHRPIHFVGSEELNKKSKLDSKNTETPKTGFAQGSQKQVVSSIVQTEDTVEQESPSEAAEFCYRLSPVLLSAGQQNKIPTDTKNSLKNEQNHQTVPANECYPSGLSNTQINYFFNDPSTGLSSDEISRSSSSTSVKEDASCHRRRHVCHLEPCLVEIQRYGCTNSNRPFVLDSVNSFPTESFKATEVKNVEFMLPVRRGVSLCSLDSYDLPIPYVHQRQMDHTSTQLGINTEQVRSLGKQNQKYEAIEDDCKPKCSAEVEEIGNTVGNSYGRTEDHTC
ncbi:unnamed protein product [Calicophoron daubneyi]|uniref:Uncharacterized protein n=1 Tax=Calicophoron daubneyi TaxID=300641 RepID=A0AAV2SWF3_CALDB